MPIWIVIIGFAGIAEPRKRQMADKPNMLSAALWYAQKIGWYVLRLHEPLFDDNGRCVGCTCEAWKRKQRQYGSDYVCPTPGKHPRVGLDWEMAATRDESTIRQWWRKYPTANVGIAAGKSGLVAVDKDTYEMTAENGKLSLVDKETITSLTGGGGEHLIYRHPADGPRINNSDSKLPDWVNIRAHGGQFVVPPSLHPSGRRYEWEEGYGPHEMGPAQLPEALRDLLQGSRKYKQEKFKLPEKNVPTGKRHPTYVSAGASMHAQGFGLEAVEAALLAVNEHQVEESKPEQEVRDIAAWVGKLEPSVLSLSKNGRGTEEVPDFIVLLEQADTLPDDPDERKRAILAIVRRAGHLSMVQWIELRDRLHVGKTVTKADLERVWKEARISRNKPENEETESPEEITARRKKEAAEQYKFAESLLKDPNLFNRIGETIHALGYAGDVKPAQLLYLTVTSRLLERPQNTHVSAQSATGKTYTVDTVLETFPSEEIYVLKAGSSRALVYADEDFEHRIIYVAEADSIPEDGPAAAAVRALAADNYMSYDVVERDEETGRFSVRHIVKPGPTGLITTSTRSLRQQMSTRMLEINLSDSEEQTRAILQAHAKLVRAEAAPTVELEPFLAMQRWLTLAGNRKVVVPFAGILADLLPDQAARSIRMRRDFRQLLTCIQSAALLYQVQRDTTAEGAIIATIEDYTIARDLLEPIFTAIVSEGVTEAVRETVRTIQEGEEVSQAELCRRLGLSKSTVSWRVKRALYGGWLVNKEERKGYAARLSLGTPLPEEIPALPLPEHVMEVFECSNGKQEDIYPIFDISEVDDEENNTPIYQPDTDSNIRTVPSPPLVDEVRTVDSNPDKAAKVSNRDSNGKGVMS